MKVTYVRTQITHPPAVTRKLGQRLTFEWSPRADEVMKRIGFERVRLLREEEASPDA